MSEPQLSRRRSETQDRLLAAAVPLFAERGISASTVELICERAGFTRGAFYSNFESKDDLVRNLLAFQRDRLASGVQHAIDEAAAFRPAAAQDRSTSPHEMLAHIVRHAMASYQQAGPAGAWTALSLLSLEVSLYAVREPTVRGAWLDNQKATLDPLADLIEIVLEVCGLRLSVSRVDAATTLLAVFQSAARRALTTGEDNVLDIVAPRYVYALTCMSEPVY
jgi:AcrR family transcriptional regulator